MHRGAVLCETVAYVQGMILSDQPTSSIPDRGEAVRERCGCVSTDMLEPSDQVHRLQTTHISQFSR